MRQWVHILLLLLLRWSALGFCHTAAPQMQLLLLVQRPGSGCCHLNLKPHSLFQQARQVCDILPHCDHKLSGDDGWQQQASCSKVTEREGSQLSLSL